MAVTKFGERRRANRRDRPRLGARRGLPFIRAIAAAAMVGVQMTQLEADLQVSRRRLVRAADLTRERFERNLHDGAHQQLVAVRLRLQLAADAIEAGSDDAAAIVERIGGDVDTALDELRRYRIGAVGGTTTISSTARHGTSISGTIPTP
jgi:signal transduction histidine kinase